MRTLVLMAVTTLALVGCKKEAGGEAVKQVAPARTVELKVTEQGFEPDKVQLKQGEPVRFRVTRVTENTCATDILVAGTDIKVKLPMNEPQEFDYTPEKAGTVKFGCAMGMMVSGVMVVE